MFPTWLVRSSCWGQLDWSLQTEVPLRLVVSDELVGLEQLS